jgi:hypothetical protein
MNIVPFKAEHLDELVVQPAQRHLDDWVANANYKALEGPHAFSAINDAGECVFCGGVTEVWPDRAQAWAIIAEGAGALMPRITKATRRLMDLVPWRRIEITVDCEFPQGHRWARLLGFTLECERMVAYTPDGRDSALYARIK